MSEYVLVTGTSSGIGKNIAVELAVNGYFVFAGVRTAQDEDALEEIHPNISPIMLDVTDDNSISEAFDYIYARTDKISAIINNAGIVTAGALEYLPVEEIKKQFEVNTFGAIRVAQKILPLLPEGKIINISSMSSTGIFPFIAPYCASKRALDIMFNSLMIEMNNPNIKVVSIKPGAVKTPVWEKSIKINKNLLKNVPEKFIEKYKNEFCMLEDNARKNTQKGLNPDKIAKLVLKVMHSKNPKPSYHCGVDSFAADFFSKFPLTFTNFVVKTILKRRLSKFKNS